MPLRNQDRELQIRLAELQADVQIYITIGFTFFAVFMAGIIGLQQIYFSLPSEEFVTKYFTLFAEILLVIFGFLVVRFFMKKAVDARKQITELRKRYVW